MGCGTPPRGFEEGVGLSGLSPTFPSGAEIHTLFNSQTCGLRGAPEALRGFSESWVRGFRGAHPPQRPYGCRPWLSPPTAPPPPFPVHGPLPWEVPEGPDFTETGTARGQAVSVSVAQG